MKATKSANQLIGLNHYQNEMSIRKQVKAQAEAEKNMMAAITRSKRAATPATDK